MNTTDHTRPAPYKLNSRLASITGPYTPGRPRAVRSVLRVELLLEPRLYHVHVHVHVVRVRRRLYTYASARRRWMRWIAYTWLQLSIGSGLQVLEALVLGYARGGARRDGASRLPNRTDL